MVVAFTGHRPEKISPFEVEVIAAIAEFLDWNKPRLVISGMAAGVDQYAALAAKTMGIPYDLYLPFPGAGRRVGYIELYEELMSGVRLVKTLYQAYEGPWVYQARNVAMVDDCELLGAVWDGSAGGTGNCLEYARSIGRPIEYLKWPRDRACLTSSSTV